MPSTLNLNLAQVSSRSVAICLGNDSYSKPYLMDKNLSQWKIVEDGGI